MTTNKMPMPNSNLKLMAKRLDIFDLPKPSTITVTKDDTTINSVLDENVIGVQNQESLLKINGGKLQQDRMIFDKRRSLDRAVLYSYQGANIKKTGEVMEEEEDMLIPCLINPDKLKQDYDDKILSVGFEYGFQPGDVFEWVGNKTYWLIYLQDLTELAYFRGEIRKCSYTIEWQEDNGDIISTYAAVQGPTATSIESGKKVVGTIDIPNYGLKILVPLNSNTKSRFTRYSKFYLTNDDGTIPVCWRVEAVDAISTPGIIEFIAKEYYINEHEPDEGVVGRVKAATTNVNPSSVDAAISGDTYIKPKKEYVYTYKGTPISSDTKWVVDSGSSSVKLVQNGAIAKVKWTSSYSGQFTLSYGDYTKTIIVESLF